MAESRTGYRGIVVGILIGLLVLAFAVWGVEDVFSPEAGNSVLKIGDQEVSSNEFRRLYDQELRDISDREGKNLTNEQAMARGIPQQILSQLLSQNILEVDAKDLGIGYNAKSALKELSQIEVFKDPITKKYSAAQVNSILARQYVTSDEFSKDLIRRKRLEQTLPAITRGIEAPSEYAETFYNYVLETRNVSVMSITDKAVDAAPEPTDEQLKTFIDENIIKFTLPEYRRVTMIRLEPTDFVLIDDIDRLGLASEENAKTAFNNIFIADEEIEAQYEIKVASEGLATPATRSLTVLFGENEDTANKIAEKIKEGLTVEDIQNLYGLNDPTTYDDVQASAIIDPEVAKAAFEMNEGDVKALLGGFDQWVAVHVTGAVEEFKPSRDTVEDEIVQEIMDIKVQNEIYDQMDAIMQEVGDGRTLEEASESSGLPFSSLPFVSRFGATPDELTMGGLNRIPGIATDREILRTIFTANPGLEVDVFDTSTGGQAILRVDDTIEERPQDFEDAKPLATVMWKEKYIEDALDDLMATLGDRVSDGEALSDVAAELGEAANVASYTLVRTRPQSEIGNQIWGDLIEGENGDVVRGLGPQKMTRQIAVLDKIVPNAEAVPDEEKSIIQDRLTAELANDILIAYQNAVTKEHPYNENQDRVNQVLGIETPAE